MQEADLYLTEVDICRYWPTDIELSCKDFIDCYARRKCNTENCPLLVPRQAHAFKLALDAGNYLPSVPLLTVPQPIEAGLVPINEPDEGSLVIVSGNNRFTFEVLATIWAQGITPA